MPHQQLISEEEDYFHIKPDPHQDTCYENCLYCCGAFTGCLKIWCPCFCCCCQSPLYQLQTAKIGIMQNFGRFKKVLKPGFHVINPWTQSVIPVDMKTNIMNLHPQQVITKDNVTLQIETVVYYRTVDPYKLVYKLGTDLRQIRTFIAQMSYNALRTVAGQHTFQQFLENRAKLADSLQFVVAPQVKGWGLYIQNIFIKDLILSEETKELTVSCNTEKSFISKHNKRKGRCVGSKDVEIDIINTEFWQCNADSLLRNNSEHPFIRRSEIDVCKFKRKIMRINDKKIFVQIRTIIT